MTLPLLLVLPFLIPAPQAEADPLRWSDALELGLEGQGWSDTAAPFDRLPAAAEALVRAPVWKLSRNSSGMVVRFRSDSPRIEARWELISATLSMPHMPATGVSGVDLYVKHEGQWRWLANGKPGAQKNHAVLAQGLIAEERDYLLYLPLYNGVDSVQIGTAATATIEAAPPRTAYQRPLVFYGTSITQGGCASRPGMTHSAILGRRLQRPVFNLGFSGQGRMDLEMADLIAEIDAAVYVIDCLPNMNANTVAARTVPLVSRLRALRPDTPILLVEDRTFTNAFLNQGRASHHAASRRALRAAYQELLSNGVQGLHYLEGHHLLGDDSEATVDGSHPTDLGFVRMADVFEPVLRDLLKPEVAPPAPYGALPSAAQLRWHRLGYYAFVHFNMNTFTDAEWGHGDETANAFLPTALDCRQWARTFRDAGMQAVILTAKHHDGFCIWPSDHTEHDVAATQWRDGKGDVLRDLSEACREYGLKFGVYLSPWDRHHPLYGSGAAYNQFFAAQLEEVLTRYGEVFEVWFDGANGEGPNGRKQVYDWDLFHQTVFRHQPDAIIFSDAGPGCRWVGNERGYAAETNWSTLNGDEFQPGTPKYRQLTEGHRDGSHWIPAECDVSIRPGWYYHPEQDDQVKSLRQLLDIYYASVGSNANLLLNLPVDRRGLVHENDAAALLRLRAALDSIFADNLARGARASASFVRGQSGPGDGPFAYGPGDPHYAAELAIDDDPDSYWCTDDAHLQAELVVELSAPQVVDHIVLQEAIALGQRVARFAVDVRQDGAWREVASGTTIGYKRFLRFSTVVTNAVRVRILESLACPTLANLELYAAPPEVLVIEAQQHFLGDQHVVLASDHPRAEIHYTLDGSAPSQNSPRYKGPIPVNRSLTLRATAYASGRQSIEALRIDMTHYDANSLRAATHFLRDPPTGLRYEAFEGGWQTLDQLQGSTATAQGETDHPSLEVRPRDENFALRFRGFVVVPKDGVYTFATRSDDGSRLWIGDQLLADNDGLHGMVEARGQIALQAGAHPITLAYFNQRGGMGLEVYWSGPGTQMQPIPATAFRR